MAAGLAEAAARLERVFAAYPRRPVLDGCPHCRGPQVVDEGNLHSLTIRLGNTVGDRHDVKSLLPLLFGRASTADCLDAGALLSKLPDNEWRTWPVEEQRAVEEYLDAVWQALLAEYPARTGAFTDSTAFLAAAADARMDVSGYLTRWDSTHGQAADRHLAELVGAFTFVRRKSTAVQDWLLREATRERLLIAFDRDSAEPWGEDLAWAYDLLPR
ncbi:hypothetical protein ACFPM7_12505 [Actinokineospora guangxiensis]|uniref:Uncharacterized protein n=1 Tax=Actinokineospora guangxiensis TaxID=1490288 RepID=A0ABW0ENH6_9PSEU